MRIQLVGALHGATCARCSNGCTLARLHGRLTADQNHDSRSRQRRRARSCSRARPSARWPAARCRCCYGPAGPTSCSQCADHVQLPAVRMCLEVHALTCSCQPKRHLEIKIEHLGVIRVAAPDAHGRISVIRCTWFHQHRCSGSDARHRGSGQTMARPSTTMYIICFQHILRVE